MTPDTLAETALRIARERVCRPTATYRLQMRREFPLAKARAILSYLQLLGISHVYSSPLLMARPGSPHGYDVIDHSKLNDEIGTEAELADFAQDLRARGMGLVLDVVPNHMCVNGANGWWRDVLAHGPSSPFANHFDIAWNDHPRERLHGKVLLPILGDMYGKSLESGHFRVEFEGGAFRLFAGGTPLPIDPRTYGKVLNPALDEARVKLGAGNEDVLELQSVLAAVGHLPSRSETDPAAIREGRYEVDVIHRRLADLAARSGDVAGFIQDAVDRLHGSPDDPLSFVPLDEWIAAQAYRPAFWRVASDEINYRRFFDVNDLAAISVEREEVFVATHAKVFEWLAAGIVDVLRIDHPDGLFDPKQYLDRLQTHYLLVLAKKEYEAAPSETPWEELRPALLERFAQAIPERLLYVVVEKILGPKEKLPADWACAGTTGYEFLANASALFVDRGAAKAVTDEYVRTTGESADYDELLYRKKFLILQSALAGELHMLAHQLDRLAQVERGSRDFTLNSLRHALREAIACFPVYRSYVTDEGVNDTDRALIQRSMIRARRRNPLLGKQIFDFIRDTLLLKDPPGGPRESYRAMQREFVGRFQQVTSPVMAKGAEDTCFYVFNRLVGLNEVGGEPSAFGTTPAELHALLASRPPLALSPLATHDTKRGEDTRARIAAISEFPDQWAEHSEQWTEMNALLKPEVEEGVRAPDANEERLLYQSLVGTWPSRGDDYADRLREYMNKVVHEAKVHTSWINPDADYDAAVGEFVGRVLASPKFAADMDRFCAKLDRAAAVNSLGMTLLKCTAPGVPDTYQGTEMMDCSLVDPDNRRSVDYPRAEALLKEWDRSSTSPLEGEVGSRSEPGEGFLQTDPSPRRSSSGDPLPQGERVKGGLSLKQSVLSRALRLRRDQPDLFRGGYVPLEVTGVRAEHVFAFLRTAGDRAALVVVPRLMGHADFVGDTLAVKPEWWGDTAIQVPEGRWVCAFTSAALVGGRMDLAELLVSVPLALLTN